MNFLDIYCIQGLGNTVSNFLDVADEQRLDSVCKDVRAFNREYVYPIYEVLDAVDIASISPSKYHTQSYIQKLAPFTKHLYMYHCDHASHLPAIEDMPRLEELVFAVPLHVDVTNGQIHPFTHVRWIELQDFLSSLFDVKNKVKSVMVVPGPMYLHRCTPGTNTILSSQVLDDETEASHLRFYRTLRMPPMLTLAAVVSPTFCLEKLHIPRELMSLGARILSNDIMTLDVSEWDMNHDGPASFLLDLDRMN